MFAIVEYNDYRKEQSFEVIMTTDNVEYAKKIAFQHMKKIMYTYPDFSMYKITTNIENHHLRPVNKTIVAYRIINVEKYKKGFRMKASYSNVCAVIELKKIETHQEYIDEIDSTLICNNYYDYDDTDDDEDDNYDPDEKK